MNKPTTDHPADQSFDSWDTEHTEMKADLNGVTNQIVGAAIEVHRALGPGLLESAYQRALAHELRLRGRLFEEQKLCSVRYKDLLIEDAYRLDFLVEESVVIEIKTIDALAGIHDAQVLKYLRFSGCKIGLLLNFRSKVLARAGLRRLAL